MARKHLELHLKREELIEVDPQTGKIRYNEKILHTDNPEPLGNGASMNSYATPTGVIEPGRVYVHFGSAATNCLWPVSVTPLHDRDRFVNLRWGLMCCTL